MSAARSSLIWLSVTTGATEEVSNAKVSSTGSKVANDETIPAEKTDAAAGRVWKFSEQMCIP